MDDTRMDVVFSGQVVPGHAVAEVKSRLAALFKTDPARIEALFSGHPVPIRRDLDAAAAQRYRQVLAQAGAVVELRSAGAAAANPPDVGSAQALDAPAGWTLTPVGADLLRPEERVPTTAEVAVAELRIDPAGADLLRPDERKPAATTAVDTSGLRLDPSH